MVMQDHITEFEDLGHRHADQTPMTFRSFLEHAFLKTQRRPLPAVPPGPLPRYEARINWGRWIVDCPHCNSGLNVTTTDTTAICLDCGTEWFEVVFPPAARKRDIERRLLKRPGNAAKIFPHSNWYPGESVASLDRENLRMGIT